MNRSTKTYLKGLLVGTGIGFALGVLFSPMRGKDIRELAAVRASEIADKAQEQYGRARDRANKAISSVRSGSIAEEKTGTES